MNGAENIACGKSNHNYFSLYFSDMLLNGSFAVDRHLQMEPPVSFVAFVLLK